MGNGGLLGGECETVRAGSAFVGRCVRCSCIRRGHSDAAKSRSSSSAHLEGTPEQLSVLILTAIVGFVVAILSGLSGVLAGRESGWGPNPGLMAFNDTLAMFFEMGLFQRLSRRSSGLVP